MIMPMRLIATMLLCLIPAFAQPPQGAPQGAPQGGRRGGPPQNLKILKAEEVMAKMGTFRAGLGVRCDHCHVQGNNASDDNPKKLIARKMITMTAEINAGFPDGKEHVTCYTCHRGKVEPEMTPPAAQ
jgi:photosynthetic reaction center cytochrome c subunit